MKNQSAVQTGSFTARFVASTLYLAGALLAVLSFAAMPASQARDSREELAPLSRPSPLAPTSGPGWSKVSSPDLGRGTLSGVACTSSTQCWGVGYYDLFGTNQTLIEQWNGSSWSIVSSPNPTSASSLSAVACASATQCWAVGGYKNSNGNQTLTEEWNGTSWSIVTSPNRLGESNYLYGVTCTSTTQCWAVGETSAGITIILLWNGSSWSLVPQPSPSGNYHSNHLYGVTCNSSSDCWAVGGADWAYNDFSGSHAGEDTFVEHWDGTAWSIISSPTSLDTQHRVLNSVACALTSLCWAVGSDTGKQTLVEQWNGTAWSVVSSPNSGTATNILNGITCTSGSTCSAVGYYANTNGRYQTLIEHWSGSSWLINSSPNSATTDDNQLTAIGCVVGVACWAVGNHLTPANLPPANERRTLIEELIAGAWSMVPSPNHVPPSGLNGITCASSTDCWAVGDYNAGTANSPLYLPLIQQWDGTSWATVSAQYFSAGSHYVNAVTCTSSSNCWAVGDYISGNHYQTFAEQWSGSSTWSIMALPNTSTTQSNNLGAVACASASQCFAAGSYLDSALNTHPLAEQWNGSAWSIVTLPANNTNFSAFNGATCPSSSQCWIVGYYTAGSGLSAQYQTLIEQWNGTTWSIVNSGNTSTAQLNILNAITCSSTSDCWAVGYYQNSSAIYQTLTQHWDGSGWSIVSSPSVGTQNNYFTSVTCNAASDCRAGGYDGASGSYQTLTEHWDGTSWSVVASLNPGGSTHNNAFNGIVCSSAALCWAGGSYNNGSIDQNLIEVYSPAVPAVTGVVSRMTHGSAGVFDVNLPLIGARGIECRSSSAMGAGNYSVVFSFVNAVTSCGTPGTTGGSVSLGPSANQCTQNLTGVANGQYTTVVLNNVTDVENNTGSVATPMGLLIGDTTGDGSVNSADISQTKSKSGQSVGITNFRNDVTGDGSLNSADISLVKSKSGTALP